MTTLHATPYNRDATGFYFTDVEDYQNKAKCHLDAYGNIVEEFEIQFVDGDDAELFIACSIDQSNIDVWLDDIEFMEDYTKISLYYLVGVSGYTLEQALNKLDEPCIYEGCLLEAATEMFDECWLPSIPDSIKFYVDYEKFARDCQMGGDMVEFEYKNETFTCTNATGV
jgi:Antirestriction protein (ArdA)